MVFTFIFTVLTLVSAESESKHILIGPEDTQSFHSSSILRDQSVMAPLRWRKWMDKSPRYGRFLMERKGIFTATFPNRTGMWARPWQSSLLLDAEVNSTLTGMVGKGKPFSTS